jgi:hypothetical protein
LECGILFLKNYPPGLPPPGRFSRWHLGKKKYEKGKRKREEIESKRKGERIRKMESKRLKCIQNRES